MATSIDEYPDFLVEAAKRVLLEIAHLLREYKDGMVIVGGSVPGMIISQTEQKHIGSIDVDIALNHYLIQDSGYRTISELLRMRGYIPGNQPFIFYRNLMIDGHEVKVEVDFLAGEYGGTSKKHRTQVVQDLKPRKARACDLAFFDPIDVVIESLLPEGGKDKALIKVASIVPFLMMKSQALNNRLKEKDAYDIYYCLSNYPGGIDEIVRAFQQFPMHSLVEEGLKIFRDKFFSIDAIGPVFVANFMGEEDLETRAFLQRDAFERVQYILRAMQNSYLIS